jgi:hypothetical protein
MKKYYETDIIELKEPHKLFSILIEEDRFGRKPSWSDIITGFQIYFRSNIYNKQTLKKYLLTKDDYYPLEKCGIDYNYCDEYNLNFLHFMLLSGLNNRDSSIDFTSNTIDYIISKTDNINHINNSGKNILFYLTSIVYNDNLNNKKYLEISAKFPQLSQHLVDSNNKNLLFSSINNGNIDLANKLIKDGVDIHLIDKRQETLLFNFLFLGCHQEHKELFDKLIMSIDITTKNKENETILEMWIRLASSENGHQWGFHKWICHTLNLINENQYFTDKKTNEQLYKILTKNKKLYFENSNANHELYLTTIKNLLERKIVSKFGSIQTVDPKTIQKL